MGVSSLVEKECIRHCSTMIWIFLSSWCLLKKLRSPSLGKWIGMERGLQSMNHVKSTLRIYSIINTLPWGKRIGFRTKIPKKVAILLRGLGVLHVVKNTRVGVFPVWMVSFWCCIKSIRWWIAGSSTKKGKQVHEVPYVDTDPDAPKRNPFYIVRSKGED